MPILRTALALRFSRLSVFQQTSLMVGAALVATELLVLIFYSIFFEERLVLDLILSAVIVLIVGYPLGFLFIGQNVKLTRMAVELDRAARTDDLTNLNNRKSFFAEIERISQRAAVPRSAFLYIDIDHFKQLNDTFGHAKGDAVLREMGAAIRRCVRDGDIAARLGGEEFGVYLHSADHAVALEVAERIRARVSRIADHVGLDGREVTVSIGLAVSDPSEEMQSLMERADRHLYRAKDKGRDRIIAAAA